MTSARAMSWPAFEGRLDFRVVPALRVRAAVARVILNEMI
jgi:hypothetical protein